MTVGRVAGNPKRPCHGQPGCLVSGTPRRAGGRGALRRNRTVRRTPTTSASAGAPLGTQPEVACLNVELERAVWWAAALLLGPAPAAHSGRRGRPDHGADHGPALTHDRALPSPNSGTSWTSMSARMRWGRQGAATVRRCRWRRRFPSRHPAAPGRPRGCAAFPSLPRTSSPSTDARRAAGPDGRPQRGRPPGTGWCCGRRTAGGPPGRGGLAAACGAR